MTARRAPLWSLLLQLTVLLLVALVVLIPLLWLLSTSLKGPAEDIFQAPPSLFPAQPSLQAYGTLFSQSPMGRYLLNSTVVSVFSVVANLLFCSLAAFPLARMRFRGRGIVLALVVATILIPFQVVMIPLYLLMVQLGLRNSLMALILPNAATAFGIYLLRQSFLGVPKELEEAARMDGCTALGEWWNVLIPAARADLITLAMFVFIGTWSDFLWPLVILTLGCTRCRWACSSSPARFRWIGVWWRPVRWCRFFRYWPCSFSCSASSSPAPVAMR